MGKNSPSGNYITGKYFGLISGEPDSKGGYGSWYPNRSTDRASVETAVRMVGLRYKSNWLRRPDECCR